MSIDYLNRCYPIKKRPAGFAEKDFVDLEMLNWLSFEERRQKRAIGLVKKCDRCSQYHTGCGHGLGPEHCGDCHGRC